MALERAVLEDPLHPKETVLARLDAIEQQMKKEAKADEQDAKGDAQSDRAMTDAIDKARRQAEELERRLAVVEKDPGAGADVRELTRAVDQLQRAVDDVKARVVRLENKR